MRKLPLSALATAVLLTAALVTGACIPADNAPGNNKPGTAGGLPGTSPVPPTQPPAANPYPPPAPPVATPPAPPAPPVAQPPAPPAPPVNPNPQPPPPPPPPRIDPPIDPPGRGDPPPDDNVVYLIVQNDQNIGQGEEELLNLLDDIGLDASELDDQENSREAFDANLVIVSERANSQGEYRNERFPVLIMNSAELEDMRMIEQNDDQKINAREAEVEDENTDIAEAVNIRENDRVQVTQNNVQLGFATPGRDAEVTLTQVNNRNRALLFTYQEGDEMQRDQDAPEARAFLGFPENALNALDADGDDLLEATILFTMFGDATFDPLNGRGRR